jgi:integrase
MKVHDNDGLHKRRGIWHYRLRIDGRWRELSTRTRNYQEARKVRQEVTEAQRSGQLPTDLAKCPFNKVALDWLEGRRVTVAPKTFSSDTGRLKPLLRAFGGRRLEELVSNGGALLRAYQLNRAKSVGPRTVNMELTVARLILKSARSWRQVADDIRPLREPSSGPGRALAPDDERRLWQVAASKPEWTVAYWCGLLAVNTAMRGGEIKHLRLGDVDLASRLLTIRRGKTAAALRVVPLNSGAEWALLRLVERATRLGASAPDHHLLPARISTERYDVTRPQLSFRSAWRKLTRAAGLRGLRFHDLRHHSITRLAEAGVADGTLMALVGHVSRRMLDHYSHIRVQAKRDAVQLLEPKAEPAAIVLQ